MFIKFQDKRPSKSVFSSSTSESSGSSSEESDYEIQEVGCGCCCSQADIQFYVVGVPVEGMVPTRPGL